MPTTLGDLTIREVPLLHADQALSEAVQAIVETKVPALPVIDSSGRLCGIFGEREFIGAAFPGYLGELHYAGFVTKEAEEMLRKRSECLSEPVSRYMNTEHIDVGLDYSDAQLAEIFLHHRVLIIPIVDDRRVHGVVTRWDFFNAIAKRLGERG